MLSFLIVSVENPLNPNLDNMLVILAYTLAGQFGLEEYEDNEGNTKTATKLIQFRSLDKLNEIKIPRVKLLDGSFMEYEDYKNKKETSKTDKLKEMFGDIVEIKDNDLPF